MQTPIVYKIYAERFKELAINGKVLKIAARKVLTWRFRIPPVKVQAILGEMHDLGLIHMNGNQHIEVTGCQKKCNNSKEVIPLEDFSSNLFR